MTNNSKSDQDKQIENLETQIISLKIRISRMEDMLRDFPNANDYFSDERDEEDDLLNDAIEIAGTYDRLSASLLQRELVIGYARASRLADTMAKMGLVGKPLGSKPREVYQDKIKEYLEENNKD